MKNIYYKKKIREKIPDFQANFPSQRVKNQRKVEWWERDSAVCRLGREGWGVGTHKKAEDDVSLAKWEIWVVEKSEMRNLFATVEILPEDFS